MDIDAYAIKVFTEASTLANCNDQVNEDGDRDLYVTLEQLHRILMEAK